MEENTQTSGSLQSSGHGVNSLPFQGPGVSLPPGSIGVQNRDVPFSSMVFDSSIPPHLTITPRTYVYQTSFGQYWFNQSDPFVFGLNSPSGTPLATKSLFLIISQSIRNPFATGGSRVIVSKDDQFQVDYDVLQSNSSTIVGHILLTVDFYASQKPKISITFTETSAWTATTYNLVWYTFTNLHWIRTTDRAALPDSFSFTSDVLRSTSRIEVGPSSDPSTWTDWLVKDWSDAPQGSFLQITPSNAAVFSGMAYAVVFPKNQDRIDPTLISSSSTSSVSTGYSTQRKVFSYGGYYFLFYYNGADIVYKVSKDQVTWSTAWVAVNGPIGYNFDLYLSGSTIALAWNLYDGTAGGDHNTKLRFRTGTAYAGDISWAGSYVTIVTFPQANSWPPSVAIGTDGTFWAGGIWANSTGTAYYHVFIYKSTDGITFTKSIDYEVSNRSIRDETLQLIPLPQGKLMALTGHYSDTTIRWRIWNPVSPTGSYWSAVQSSNQNLPSNTDKWNLISAASSVSDGLVHLVFQQYTGGSYYLVYTYYNVTSGTWASTQTLQSGSTPVYPSIAVDTVGDLYVFWTNVSGSTTANLYYASKPKGGSNWSISSQPFGTVTTPNWISSNRLSSKEVMIFWTQAGSSPYSLYLGTIPLSGGVASSPPIRPWSKPGLSPYEQYFTQNGEYVSPGNGLLTISQTDISVPGRKGLDLAITRIYTQPFTFDQNAPFNYETSPYANLGNGWALNLPWVAPPTLQGPQYLHLMNGESYPMIWSSIAITVNNGHQINTYTLENHQTEDFVLVETQDVTAGAVSYKLTMKDGSVLNFNGNGVLTSFVDRTTQNQLTLAYSGNNLANITDTVGRLATFKYDANNHLANATYGGQTVRYGYSGTNLVTVTDAVGRITTISYSGPNNWLVSSVTYSAGGKSSYAYGSATFGTDAVNYYVNLQNLNTTATSLIKSSSLSYNITDGEITLSSVKQSDGANVQGYTNYEFNALSSSMGRTVLNATLVQMLRDKFWYDPNGRSVQDDVFSGNSLARSFYNSRFYDLWGNVIYTRDNIGHESYQSSANTDTQWTFYGPGSLSTSTGGKLFYDDFIGPSLNITAWAQGGSASSKTTTVAGSLLTLSAASSSSGTWQSNWIRSTGTYSYPFYAEVQMANRNNPGDTTVGAELILSPQSTSSSGDPFNNNDALRLVLNDAPWYRVEKNVGGTTTTVWTGSDTGTHSVSWKIVLTDRNTLTVYLNRGASAGYEQVYTTTSLGLSSSFTPAYAYLSFGTSKTSAYSAIFDYVGLYGSNSVTLNGLQSNQKVELYDWNDVLRQSGIVANGQTSLMLDATQMPFPYGYFKIYELDGRSVQFTSSIRDVWGGSTYSYTKPFKSGGETRTATGFLQASTVYVDDSLPTGAVSYSDGGDAWNWITSGYGPVVSGSQSHVGFVGSGEHEHLFNQSSSTFIATSGYFHTQYVYIPSGTTPSEIMLQFHQQGGTWAHRAYWGTDLIPWGTNGTTSRHSMGALPSGRNSWLMFIAKTNDVGTNGLTVDGLSYTLYNGGVYWDFSALGTSSTGTITFNNLVAGQKVELYDGNNFLKVSGTVATGQTSLSLDVYSAGINVFPFLGLIKIYAASGSLQYSSPLLTDLWGGDAYWYNQPIFSNSFNPGGVGTSIHNVSMGQAQYQNATSTPEEGYSNYDSTGNLLQSSQMHNNSPQTTTYAYDTSGNQLSSISPTNEKSYFTYSSTYQHAYLTTMTRVLTPSVNVTNAYSYNFTTGQRLSMIDPMGNETDYTYDAITRMTSITHPAVGGTRSDMSFLFEDTGNSFGIENEKGNYTDFHYDGISRITKVDFYKGALNNSPIISEQNYTYNWQNQFKARQDPTGNLTTYTYDYLGRLVKVVNPDGTNRTVSNDDVSLIQSNFDENGHRTDSLYDLLHRLTGVREFYSTNNYYLTTYTYDGVGNLAKAVTANGQTTTYFYDDLNRLALTLYPDGFNETRSYDAVSNLLTRRDPNGRTVNYSYDMLNRLGNITYPDSTKATYTYDKNGNMLGLSYLGNTATFSYDSRNRETGETWTISGSQRTLSYSYDQVGNVASVTYPDNTKVNFSIDAINRATTVKTGSTTLATIAYRPDTKVSNITYGNGVQTIYRYDNRGRSTEITVVQGQTTLLDLTYGYDHAGNVVGLGNETYSYDYLNRLTTGAGPWGITKYGYDVVGNRLWTYQNPSNTTYAYGSYNRLTSVGSTSYTYDNNGNRLTQVSGGTTTTYSYDFENRLTSVSQSASTLGNYTYSPLGQRIQKIESGTTTTYVNTGVNVLYEKAGSTVNDYIFTGNLLLAKLSGSNIYYFHQDGLGSTRLVTTGSTIIFSTNYQPFGSQYGFSGTDPNYKYTGKPQDSATGLYYYGARYYDSATGRYISRDPAGQTLSFPQAQCRYAYVRNNPESLTDPTGACLSGEGLAVGLVLLALSLTGIWVPAGSIMDLVNNLFWTYIYPGRDFLNRGDWGGFAWNVVVPALIGYVLVQAIYRFLSWWLVGFFIARVLGGFFEVQVVLSVVAFLAGLAVSMLWPPNEGAICGTAPAAPVPLPIVQNAPPGGGVHRWL